MKHIKTFLLGIIPCLVFLGWFYFWLMGWLFAKYIWMLGMIIIVIIACYGVGKIIEGVIGEFKKKE